MDCEFIEDGHTIDLISIGIVSEDGRELYVIDMTCPFYRASDWVKENVLVHLPDIVVDGEPIRPENIRRAQLPDERQPLGVWRTPDNIRELVVDLMGDEFPAPELWAYYGAYDWVVLCQLFGRMIDLPEGFPRHIMDIKQFAVFLGNPRLPKKPKDKHNALADAKWTKKAWEFLNARREGAA
jgi:hypothetical protein